MHIYILYLNKCTLKLCYVYYNFRYSLEEKITSLVSQLDKLEEEKGTKDSTNREKENEIEQLKQKINEGEENLKKLNGEFEQAKLEIRRQGTLSLEMKDYEVSMVFNFSP